MTIPGEFRVEKYEKPSFLGRQSLEADQTSVVATREIFTKRKERGRTAAAKPNPTCRKKCIRGPFFFQNFGIASCPSFIKFLASISQERPGLLIHPALTLFRHLSHFLSPSTADDSSIHRRTGADDDADASIANQGAKAEAPPFPFFAIVI